MDSSRAICQFRCNEIDKTKLHKEWDVWKTSLEYYFEAEEIVDQKKKRAKLLHLGGPQLQSLFQSLPDREKYSYVTPEKQYYDVAIRAFDNFFQPGRQDVLERHNLRRMKQGHGERFAEFVVRIRQQIEECGLDKYTADCRQVLTELMLTDVIVEGCQSDELRRQILQKDRPIDEIIEIGKSLEGVQQQIKDFGSTNGEKATMNQVYNVDNSHKRSFQAGRGSTKDAQTKFRKQEWKCFKCGFSGHISSDPTCPARGKRCNCCKESGHFESQCRKKKIVPGPKKRFANTRTIRSVQSQAAPENAQQDLPEGSVQENLPKTYYAFHLGNQTNVIDCNVGGVVLPMLVDSGADANLITEEAWLKLKDEKVVVRKCEKGSDRVLKSYGNNIPLNVLGTFVAEVTVGARSTVAEFFVIQGGQRSLLGDLTSKQLGVLRVGLDISQVTEKRLPLPKITGVQVHIHLDPDAKPVFQPVRRVPVALEEAVFRKLDEFLAKDIIEEKKGPVTWVSPLVVVGKANGEPRICLDLRRVNEAVVRERHPMPLIEDFLARVGGNMIRSKLDVKDSFLQLELDDESRDAMVFITGRGLMRFKRMPFGLVTAPEIFQKTMDEILAGCDGTWWYIDDIYVEGKDKEEHDLRLAQV